jgi:hypothetical protein
MLAVRNLNVFLTTQVIRSRAMDFIYVALTLALFALSWGLVRLCDRV